MIKLKQETLSQLTEVLVHPLSGTPERHNKEGRSSEVIFLIVLHNRRIIRNSSSNEKNKKKGTKSPSTQRQTHRICDLPLTLPPFQRTGTGSGLDRVYWGRTEACSGREGVHVDTFLSATEAPRLSSGPAMVPVPESNLKLTNLVSSRN